jgi:hypothetical protein
MPNPTPDKAVDQPISEVDEVQAIVNLGRDVFNDERFDRFIDILTAPGPLFDEEASLNKNGADHE